jgi:hypothetical protein
MVYVVQKLRGEPSEDSFFAAGIGGILFWIVVGIGVGVYAGISESESPDLVTLKKDSWQCVNTHKERRLIGKIWMDVDVCDTYQMKGQQ